MASSHEKAAPRPDRKTIEKNRRTHMKLLSSKLISLLPRTNSQQGVVVPLPERLDEAVTYIKDMQAKVERMSKRKRQLLGAGSSSTTESSLPKIEVQELSHGLRVVILSRPGEHRLTLWEVVRVLEAEGFEVVAASYVVGAGDRAFCTVQSSSSTGSAGGAAAGDGAGKVLERLKKAAHADY